MVLLRPYEQGFLAIEGGLDWLPNWLDGEEWPFLEAFWESEESRSESFLQDGRAYQARRLSHEVLLLRHLGSEYDERQRVLQKARDLSLVHEKLESEISKKDYLLHCIVHDLVGPLTCIKGALHLLGQPAMSAEKRQSMLAMCVRQTARQEAMIGEILQVFGAEMKPQSGRPVDLLAVVEQACEGLRAAYAAADLQLSVQAEPLSGVADEAALERALSNLLENALRNLSAGRSVEVRLGRCQEWALLEVLDDGAGVPPEAVGNLFRKLAKGSVGGGKIGLGLYYCKLVVEGWGGSIGYSPRPEGGANFWMKLRLSE